MSAAETPDTDAGPMGAGAILSWQMGSVAPWGMMTVDFGPFTAKVEFTSRQARQFAIETLMEQGPYLGYQPPNPNMRERESAGTFGYGRGDLPRWRQRGDFRDCASALRELRERYGEEAFGWGLQQVADDAERLG